MNGRNNVLVVLIGLSLAISALAAGAAPPLVVTLRALKPRSDPRYGALRLLAAYELSSRSRSFGGLSGLCLSEDGRELLFVSDAGRWFRAKLLQRADGQLRGLAGWRGGPLRAEDGRSLPRLRLAAGPAWDAEAVSASRGQIFVSFEHAHRILVYSAFERLPRRLVLPASLQQAPPNAGLESMTALADGRLLLLTEGYFDHRALLHGYLQRAVGSDSYAPLRYRISDGYLPTDLAPLADGGALVLERLYLPLPGGRAIGPSARIRWLKARQLRAAPKVLEPFELGRLERGLVDNFEGLATQRWGKSWLIYIVSDDNFQRSQKTLLYQLRWTPPAPSGKASN